MEFWTKQLLVEGLYPYVTLDELKVIEAKHRRNYDAGEYDVMMLNTQKAILANLEELNKNLGKNKENEIAVKQIYPPVDEKPISKDEKIEELKKSTKEALQIMEYLDDGYFKLSLKNHMKPNFVAMSETEHKELLDRLYYISAEILSNDVEEHRPEEIFVIDNILGRAYGMNLENIRPVAEVIEYLKENHMLSPQKEGLEMCGPEDDE